MIIAERNGNVLSFHISLMNLLDLLIYSINNTNVSLIYTTTFHLHFANFKALSFIPSIIIPVKNKN